MISVPKTAAYDPDTGELRCLAPEGILLDGTDSVDLPSDYSDEWYTWDASTRAMVYNMTRIRDHKKMLLNQERDVIQSGGCPTPHGVVQTDDKSRQFLSGAVQMAMLALSNGQPFSIDWTMADNSVVAHSAQEIIVVGVTVGQFMSQIHYVCVGLKNAVDAATRKQEVEEISWPT